MTINRACSPIIRVFCHFTRIRMRAPTFFRGLANESSISSTADLDDTLFIQGGAEDIGGDRRGQRFISCGTYQSDGRPHERARHFESCPSTIADSDTINTGERSPPRAHGLFYCASTAAQLYATDRVCARCRLYIQTKEISEVAKYRI